MGMLAADGLFDGTALDTELLLDCLRPHDICHERSAPGFCAGWDRMDMGLLMACLRPPWTRSCCWTA